MSLWTSFINEHSSDTSNAAGVSEQSAITALKAAMEVSDASNSDFQYFIENNKSTDVASIVSGLTAGDNFIKYWGGIIKTHATTSIDACNPASAERQEFLDNFSENIQEDLDQFVDNIIADNTNAYNSFTDIKTQTVETLQGELANLTCSSELIHTLSDSALTSGQNFLASKTETYELSFRLDDQPDNGYSLDGLIVEVKDTDASGSPIVAQAITDDGGNIDITYSIPDDGTVGSTRNFELSVSKSDGTVVGIYPIIDKPLGSLEPTAVGSIPPAPEHLPTTTITVINSGFYVDTTEIDTFLSGKSITELEDVRTMGCLTSCAGFPTTSTAAATADLLESYAELELLTREPDSTHPDKSEHLIDSGYTTISSIADTDLETFVDAAENGSSPTITRKEASTWHAQAKAYAHITNNVLWNALSNRAALGNVGIDQTEKDKQGNAKNSNNCCDLDDLLTSNCNCPDCQSAVSPQAYLVSLIKYTTKTLKIKSGSNYVGMDIEDLESEIKQELSSLSNDCSNASSLLCKIRLTTEVLQRYYDETPAHSDRDTAAYSAGLNVYLSKTYKALLNALNTTYEELQKVKGGSEEQQQKLADRMGIAWSSGVLDQLYFNLDAASFPLTFEILEQTFGIKGIYEKSNSNYIETDSNEILRSIHLENVVRGLNTDVNGKIYLKTLAIPSGDPSAPDLSLEIYKDSALTTKIGSAQSYGGVSLNVGSEKGYRLQGHIVANDVNWVTWSSGADTIVIQADDAALLPYLKHQKLLDNWRTIDDDAVLPIIDPTIMGPANIVQVDPNASAYTDAIDRWTDRSTDLKNVKSYIESKKDATNTTDLSLNADTTADITNVEGLALSSTKLYVTDGPSHQIHMLDKDTLGGPVIIPGPYVSNSDVVGISIEETGSGDKIWISDKGNATAEDDKVYRIDVAGTEELLLAKSVNSDFQEVKFTNPQDVVFDDGKVIVADTGNDAIKVFDLPETFSAVSSIPSSGEYGEIKALDNGTIFIADPDNHRIHKYSSRGTLLQSYGFNTSDGDVGTWLLNNDTTESTTPGKDLTMSSGSPKYGTGRADFAILLDGTQYLKIPTHSDLDSSSADKRSISIWFKINDATANRKQVLYEEGSSTDGLSAYVESGCVYIGGWSDDVAHSGSWTSGEFIDSSNIQSNTWHHLVIVLDAEASLADDALSAYLDNELITHVVNDEEVPFKVKGATLPSRNVIGIGGINGADTRYKDGITPTSANFGGLIDEVRIWNRVLAANDIDALFNGNDETDQRFLNSPRSVAPDPSGEFWVADTGNKKIKKFSTSGEILSSWGTAGTANSGDIDTPVSIAYNNSSQLLTVVDNTNNRLYGFDTEGNLLFDNGDSTFGDASTANGEFTEPISVTQDAIGNIYVADFPVPSNTDLRIQKFDNNGVYQDSWDTVKTNIATSSLQLAIDAESNLWITNGYDSKIDWVDLSTPQVESSIGSTNTKDPYKITNAWGLAFDSSGKVFIADGTSISHFKRPVELSGPVNSANTFSAPTGIGVDKFGNIFVADTGNDQIFKLDSNHEELLVFGASGTADGELSGPSDVHISKEGLVFVVDKGNNRIQLFDESGNFIAKWTDTEISHTTVGNPQSFVLDEQGRFLFTNQDNNKVVRKDPLDAMGEMIKSYIKNGATGLTLAKVDELVTDFDLGTDIQADMDAYGLNIVDLRYIYNLSLRTRRGLAPDDAEWAYINDILIRQYTADQYTTWKSEEAADGIFLNPIDFRLHDKYQSELAVTYLGETAYSEKRVTWFNALKERTDEWNNSGADYKAQLKDVEDKYLIELRDTLVLANTKDVGGSSLASKAKYLGDQFFTDLQVNCCQDATRVSFAIDTLQNLLWSARTSNLAAQAPDVKLYAENFDADWKWIGSYASWRSAAFLYMYPENLLKPSLRPWKSPQFSELQEAIRKERNLTNSKASELADAFYQKLNTLSHITIQGCAQAYTRFSDKEQRKLVYQFGKSVSGEVFYAYYDIQNLNGFAQDYWRTIEGLKDVASIVGTREFETKKGDRLLYLFLTKKQDGKERLFYIRYDLEQLTWEEEATEIEMNLEPTKLDVTIWANENPKVNIEISIRVPKNEVQERDQGLSGSFLTYIIRMDGEGEELAHEYWSAFSTWGHMQYALRYKGKYFWIITDGDGQTVAVDEDHNYTGTSGRRKSKGSNKRTRVINTKKNLEYMGCITDSDNDKFYVLHGVKAGANIKGNYTAVKYYIYDFSANSVSGPFNIGVNSLTSIFEITADTSTDQIQFIGDTSRGEFQFTYAIDAGNSQLALRKQRRIVPDLRSSYRPKAGLSPGKLKKLRTKQIFSVNENFREFRSIANYSDEFYYAVPLLIAESLVQTGDYEHAFEWYRTIYDYTQGDEDCRMIWHGLRVEQNLKFAYYKLDDWLIDSFNPHSIAGLRSNSYITYTLMSIVQGFLKYADSEYAADSAASIERASELYERALELLDHPILGNPYTACDEKIDGIEHGLTQPEWISLWEMLKQDLYKVQDPDKLDALVTDIQAIFDGVIDDEETKLIGAVQILDKIEAALYGNTAPRVYKDSDRIANLYRKKGNRLLNAYPTLRAYVGNVIELVKTDQSNGLASITSGIGQNGTCGTYTGNFTNSYGLHEASADDTNAAWNGNAAFNSTLSIKETIVFPSTYYPEGNLSFCVPFNPFLYFLRLKAEVNLQKIRNCLNVAGIKSLGDPYGAPTDSVSGLPMPAGSDFAFAGGSSSSRETQYKYQVLIQRVRELVNNAQQVEASYLSALEKFDAEKFNYQRAKQDLRKAKSASKLQDIRVNEASASTELARKQKAKSDFIKGEYQNLIDEGLNGWETTMIISYTIGGIASITAEIAQLAYQAAQITTIATAGGGGLSAPVSVAAAVVSAAPGYAGLITAGVARSTAIGANTTAQIASVKAAQSRREEQWDLQKLIAEKDSEIGSQGIKIAQTREKIVQKERDISNMQMEHSQWVVDYLQNKFTNYELYEWMMETLGDVYSYFLQEATSLAMTAQKQLSFERQQLVPSFIKSDYWEVESKGSSIGPDAAEIDRKGLTGSVRLLQDVEKLHQHAFDTNKRKLQLTKTISLASLAPEAFENLKSDGVVRFATPMNLFDKDFPGHYLRLINKVSTSVVALVPPREGIKATLTNTGFSRITVGASGIFTTLTNRSTVESVALTSPIGDSGVFQLRPENSQFLNPFESIGVDTFWEFRMPKASNRFDYASIADVLLTIEYTALEDSAYRKQMENHLEASGQSSAISYSIKNYFPDQWYDLHNPDQVANPMEVSFELSESDFPVNLSEIKIDNTHLLFVRNDAVTIKSFDLTGKIKELKLVQSGMSDTSTNSFFGNGERGIRRSNAFDNKSPFGTWTLSLNFRGSDEELAKEVEQWFADEAFDDIILVIDYKAQTPAWPE